MATIRIFNHYLRIPFVMLGLIEFFVLCGSVYGAAYIRFYNTEQAMSVFLLDMLPRALFFAASVVFCMTALGLYQGRLREGMSGVMLRTIVSFMAAGVVMSAAFYAFPDLYLGRGVLVLATVLSFFVIGTIRPIFFDSVDESMLKRRVAVYGAGQKAAAVLKRLRRKSDQRSFHLLGFIDVPGVEAVVKGKRIIELKQSLVDYALSHEVDEIVVALDEREQGYRLDDLLACRMSGIDVVDVLTFFEREAGKVRVDMLDLSWLVFSDGFKQSGARTLIKRTSDIGASLFLLALTWPIMLLTALAIRAESRWRGPVFYSQIRVGQFGKLFKVLKFRSMRTDAEIDGKARWATENDDRVTRVGAFIRKVRIDELPQIFNVLRGDMSFVGPRPERPEFVDILSEKIPYYQERHRVKPGITGWAQLCYPYGSSDEDATEKQQYDLYYVKNHSLFLDTLILMQTAEVVLFGKGAR